MQHSAHYRWMRWKCESLFTLMSAYRGPFHRASEYIFCNAITIRDTNPYSERSRDTWTHVEWNMRTPASIAVLPEHRYALCITERTVYVVRVVITRSTRSDERTYKQIRCKMKTEKYIVAFALRRLIFWVRLISANLWECWTEKARRDEMFWIVSFRFSISCRNKI